MCRFGFHGGLGFIENVWFYGDLSLCRFEFNGGLGFMEVWVLWRFEFVGILVSWRFEFVQV